jgi:nucleoside-diphosphate-sugar epimerase
MASKNRAIVFGASGLLGWSVVNQLLSSYPQAGSFESVAAIVNRPVSEKDLHLPAPSLERPECEVISGIDLQRGSGEDLAEELKAKVSRAGEITHVFYFGTQPTHCANAGRLQNTDRWP